MENEILTSEDFMAESIEDLSAEMTETAEPSESEESTEEVVEQAEPEVQNEVDVNAIYAEARRTAEANARKAQKSIDEEYVRRFGHLNNPITGQPIRSQADYLAALDAQEEMKAKNALQEKGVDPALIDNLIANNPVIRQAEAVMAQAKKAQTLGEINADIAELNKIDPSITDISNVPPDVIRLSLNSGGNIHLVDAYKIVNFGKVSQDQRAAIQQSAINQAKGKQHLSPVNGVATPDEGVEIPASELNMWKDMFPDKSSSELRKLYNKTLQ